MDNLYGMAQETGTGVEKDESMAIMDRGVPINANSAFHAAILKEKKGCEAGGAAACRSAKGGPIESKKHLGGLEKKDSRKARKKV